MTWLAEFLYWIARWFPHLFIVRATHSAVKFKRGKHVVTCGPGLHFWWPLVTQVILLPTVRQTANLPTQVILIGSGQPLVVSGVVVYEVRNVEKALGRSWDVDDTIEDLALTGILETLAGQPLEDLVTDLRSGGLSQTLTLALRKQLRPFGVYVQHAGLTDFSIARAVHLTGGTEGAPIPTEED